LIVVLIVFAVALPASLLAKLLPANIGAEDLSGSIWHGSIGRLTVNGRDAGAVEWRLHPGALLRLALSVDLHWVKTGFVIDGSATLDRSGFAASGVHGGGPIEDLQDLGAAGLHGTAQIALPALAGDNTHIGTVMGDVRVDGLVSERVAGGALLGGYTLHFADDAVGGDGAITGRLTDLGGPVEVQGIVRIVPSDRNAVLSGTVKESAAAAQALRAELDKLAQLRGRDSQGRIPVELEFAY
jgi:general secretion pathway protein N